MKKAWSVVLVVVFIIVLLGAIAIGVGYITGADLEQVYGTLQNAPVGLFIRRLIGFWNQGVDLAEQLIASLSALFA